MQAMESIPSPPRHFHLPCIVTSVASLSSSTRARLASAAKNADAPLRPRPALLLQAAAWIWYSKGQGLHFIVPGKVPCDRGSASTTKSPWIGVQQRRDSSCH